jgi:hypothetical protein
LNEVEIVVKATDRGAKETLAGVGESAKKMSKDFDSSSPGVKRLRNEFDDTAASVRKMKAEFAKSGDMDLWKDIESGEKKLKSLKTELVSLGSVGGSVGSEVKKALKGIGDEGGKAFGDGLQSNALQSIKGIATSPVGLAVGVGLAAAISPMIGAAVGAGVTASLGGGILALGIARAAADSRVSAAWGGMWDGIGQSLDKRAGTFVQPLIKASDLIGSSIQANAIPKIADAFDTLRPRIMDLAGGMSSAIANIFKGANFDRITDLADRLLGRLAKELPNFGNAINNFLGSIADAGPGIEQFWGEFLVGTQRTIVGIGNVIEALSDTYKVMDDVGNVINDGFDKASVAVDNFLTTTTEKANKFSFAHLFGWDEDSGDGGPVRKLNMLKQATDEVGDSAIQAGVSYSDMMKEISGSAETMSTVYGAAVDKVMSTTMGLDQATLGLAESETRMADSVRQNGTSLDIHTAKGQANREAILGMVSANQQSFDANIRAGMGAEQARAAYEDNTRAIEASMRAAGFNQQAIDGMIGKYRSVPANIATDIELHGLTEAIHGLDDTLRKINGLDGRVANVGVTTTYTTTYRTNGTPAMGFSRYPGEAHGGITGAASGGPRGNWTMVGEQGRELVKLPAGSQVIPHGGTEAMMGSHRGSGGRGGGGNHYTLNVSVPLGAAASTVGAEIVEAIKGFEDYNGAGWRS